MEVPHELFVSEPLRTRPFKPRRHTPVSRCGSARCPQSRRPAHAPPTRAPRIREFSFTHLGKSAAFLRDGKIDQAIVDKGVSHSRNHPAPKNRDKGVPRGTCATNPSTLVVLHAACHPRQARQGRALAAGPPGPGPAITALQPTAGNGDFSHPRRQCTKPDAPHSGSCPLP